MTAFARRITSSRFVRGDLRAAILPWSVSRALVLGSLWASRYMVDQLDAPRRLPLGQGLFGWDATFYRTIAEHGYAAIGETSLRFFPLVPLATRLLGVVLLGNDALALLVIVNGSALVFAALAHRIVIRETGNGEAARRAAWFALVVPPAATLMMGYAEATFLALVAGSLLAYRTDHWGWGAGTGLLAALCRPLGVLLMLPAAVEGWRGWPAATARSRVLRIMTVAAPAVGTGCYLAWSSAARWGFWRPFAVQSDVAYRGDFVDPVTRTARAVRLLSEGDRFDSGRQLLWLVLFIALLVVMARRLPAGYVVFGVAALVTALSTENIQSLERYGTSGLVLALGLPLVTTRREVERAVVALAAGGLVAYSVLGFAGVLVP